VRRTLAVLVAAPLLLAGCGEPSAEEVRTDYCETVAEQQRALSDRLADRSPTVLLDAQPIFRDLAAEAPSDIADDWDVLLDAIDGLDRALADAGVDPATYDAAKPPSDLTDEQRDTIERAAAELLNPRTEEAVAAVDQQARDVCGTPLFQ
jgi:hypothetical protein